MKDKKFIITIISVIVAIPILLFLISLLFTRAVKKPSTTTPSPTQAPLLKTSIQNNQINVPLDGVLTVDFGRPIQASEFAVTYLPVANFSTQASGTILTVTPSSPLKPSTRYSITVSTADRKKLLVALVFTSLGPTPTFRPDTRPSGEPQRSDDLLRQNHPDNLIANHLPYETSDFKAVYTYKVAPTGHFAFTVTLLGANKDSSKLSFITWVKSFGLSDTQINQLDITYQ